MGTRLPELLLRSQSDDRLVSLARAGDERAFAAIVERYGQELHGLACRMRMNGRAEDIVQQTFMSAFAALRSGTDVNHLRGWLYRILRNEAIRASGRRVIEVELDPAAAVSEPLEDGAQRRMLAFDTLASVAALPARQRDALVATALGGHSRAAVAASMGVSEGAVRQLMHRARATLRNAATAILPGPLARFVHVIRNATRSDQAEIVLGASAASGGGVAVKVGALVASGVVATGIVGSQLAQRHGHSRVARARAAVAPIAGTGASAGGAPDTIGARVRPSSGAEGLAAPGHAGGVAPVRPSIRGRDTHGGGAGARDHVLRAPGAAGGPGPAPSHEGSTTNDGSAQRGSDGSHGSDGGSASGGEGSSGGQPAPSREGASEGSTPTDTLAGSSDGGRSSGDGSPDGGSSTATASSTGNGSSAADGSSTGDASSTGGGSSDGGSPTSSGPSSRDGSGDGGSGRTNTSDSGGSSDG
jgi:RNA polymerase sigma factor (sigma-70 family)